ncbi:hypothetical protein QFC19_004475 [Naganishia cerealis]|uniref:Uncharacterized protein n=1 Tax=Naganishia cerealis TaxID=610337 RepID=A0ACC2VXP7_9TREE|nr:hypothetical protein QFC19_004475 [Naganishia cerealis]
MKEEYDMTVPQLPTDVIGLIAEELQSRFHFRTCANLNMSCRDVFEQTLPILWKLVIFRKSAQVEDPGNWSRFTKSSGAKYIEFLINLDDAETQQLPPPREYDEPPPHGATDPPADRCKAILCGRKGMVPKQLYAYLWKGYRYGGRDVVGLLIALNLLLDISRPQGSADTGTLKGHLHLIPMSKHLSHPPLHRITSQCSVAGEMD